MVFVTFVSHLKKIGNLAYKNIIHFNQYICKVFANQNAEKMEYFLMVIH